MVSTKGSGKMNNILIVAIPVGYAPEWVMKEFVGLKLPLAVLPHQEKVPPGIILGKPGSPNGYRVEIRKAVEILKTKNTRAAHWWLGNVIFEQTPYLIFSKDVCRLI